MPCFPSTLYNEEVNCLLESTGHKPSMHTRASQLQIPDIRCTHELLTRPFPPYSLENRGTRLIKFTRHVPKEVCHAVHRQHCWVAWTTKRAIVIKTALKRKKKSKSIIND